MRSPDPRETVDNSREQAPEMRTQRRREVICRLSDDEIRAMKIVGVFRTVNGLDMSYFEQLERQLI